MWAIAIAIWFSPRNGLLPASASYATTPSEYRSVAPVEVFPVACSGAKY